MRSWRIAIEEAALDRSCEGAMQSGGHWHQPGLPALYAASTAELAVLEKFVHADENDSQLVLVAIDLPDDKCACSSCIPLASTCACSGNRVLSKNFTPAPPTLEC